MKYQIQHHDLGEGVVFGISRTSTLTLLIINTREVSAASADWARQVREDTCWEGGVQPRGAD